MELLKGAHANQINKKPQTLTETQETELKHMSNPPKIEINMAYP